MFEKLEVESPCINVCQMDEKSGLCIGCYRNIEEIQGWWEMTFEQKADVIKKTWAREEQAFN